MNLKELFAAAGLESAGSDAVVRGVTVDSRRVDPGFVFVAVRGQSGDGHAHLGGAIDRGAVALIVEDAARVPAEFGGVVVTVPHARATLDRLATHFYGEPARGLFNVGVTGTNGKTTVSYMVEKIFAEAGIPTGVMGTIDHHLGARVWASELTTPDPVTLQGRLREFADLGARAAVFEVSSHALDQSRVDGLPFDVAIFTNLTRDHLDYHRDMDTYFHAKERLFRDLLGRRTGGHAILNGDDERVTAVRVADGVTTWRYGEAGDFAFAIERADLNGTRFRLVTPVGTVVLTLPSPGRHNVYNAVAAIAAGVARSLPLDAAAAAMETFYGAPGRLEKVPNARGVHVFVDYAHTDDALDNVLSSLTRARIDHHGRARLITVFGCGGDRDRGKRPLMARAACAHADVIVVTSDNPRTEDPDAILDDVVAGVPAGWRGTLIREVDRRLALARALQCAETGDVILVAGKGHEDYQIVGTSKLPFSDQRILEHLLKD